MGSIKTEIRDGYQAGQQAGSTAELEQGHFPKQRLGCTPNKMVDTYRKSSIFEQEGIKQVATIKQKKRCLVFPFLGGSFRTLGEERKKILML